MILGVDTSITEISKGFGVKHLDSN